MAIATIASTTRLLLRCATGRTTLGIVGEAFAGEELLFTCRESEHSPTLFTLHLSGGETHWMTSLSKDRDLHFGHPMSCGTLLEVTLPE